MLNYKNYDLTHIVTPIKVNEFVNLLTRSHYPNEKLQFIKKGFTEGFSIGYQGNMDVQLKSPNLKLTVGSQLELWNKVMAEVKDGRFAGPFDQIPFQNYIQSPIGLVPKDGGQKTRLIFHLSYPRNSKSGQKLSLNANTPQELTRVKYNDLDVAVNVCLQYGKQCKIGKSDMSRAFRNLPIRPDHWPLLVMKAKSPFDGTWKFFVDKCLPFRAAISCSLFQEVSDAIAHLVRHLSGLQTINYLDDFMFVAPVRSKCKMQINTFLSICNEIQFPISAEKTVYPTHQLVFLGVLIDIRTQKLYIPVEKILKATGLINKLLTKRKATLREIQQICGLLNFFGKCIVPGRAFTRRMYALTQNKFKPHHHIDLTSEFKADLNVWLQFMAHQSLVARPLADLSTKARCVRVNFFTDASRNKELGCGGISGKSWFHMRWDPLFIQNYSPSIAYLELFALTVGVTLWIHKYQNRKIAIFCDNQSVMHMVNRTTSKCKNCMFLIRHIVLLSLIHNVKIQVKYVTSKNNLLSDCLSRNKLKLFKKLAGRRVHRIPDPVPAKFVNMASFWKC